MPRLDTDARRAQLIEHGLALFGERPYDEVAIDDIARVAGVSKGLLYHYFGSKREFYAACVAVSADRLLEATEPDLTLEPVHRVTHSLLRYIDFVDERAAAYTALVRGGVGADARIITLIEGTRERIVFRILEGMGLEEPRPVFRLAMRAWIGGVEAACLDWLVARDVDRPVLVQILLASLASHVLAAIQADPGAPLDGDVVLSALAPWQQSGHKQQDG
jgi:AcrR family transcriptional regulator